MLMTSPCQVKMSYPTRNRFLQTHDPETDPDAFDAAWTSRNADAAEVARFAPNYAGSPIVPGSTGRPGALGDHRFEARAGHHLAPAVLADGTQAFDHVGSGFTLLACGANPRDLGAAEQAARTSGVPVRIVATDGPTPYGAKFILVRPDHFVAWVGEAWPAERDVLAAAAGYRS